MGTYDNMAGELQGHKKDQQSSRPFEYAFTVWVPNSGAHTPPPVNPPLPPGTEYWPGGPMVPSWPGATPGTTKLRLKVEDDADFRIDYIIASAYGPVRWLWNAGSPTTPIPFRDMPLGIAACGYSTYPLPGTPDTRTLALPASVGVGAEGAYGFAPSDVDTGLNRITLSGIAASPQAQPFWFSAAPGDTLPAPLVAGKVYYLISLGSNHFKVALSPQLALAGTAVDLTTAGVNPSTSNFTAHLVHQRAERGISLQRIDRSSTDRLLDASMVPLECMFPPAYGTHIPGKFEFGYTLLRQHELWLQFNNRDSAGPDFYHILDITFVGRKFYT